MYESEQAIRAHRRGIYIPIIEPNQATENNGRYCSTRYQPLSGDAIVSQLLKGVYSPNLYIHYSSYMRQ